MKATDFMPGISFKLNSDKDTYHYHYDSSGGIHLTASNSRRILIGLVTAKKEDFFELTIFHLDKVFKNSIPYKSLKII